jgi:hypothetical protein|nr:hypothetical protein [uncultured Flavobacterium sp.]
MKSNVSKVFGLVFFLSMLPMMAVGQITTKKVTFPAGNNGTTITGVITGDQTIDYTIGASQGQVLKVSMKSNINASYFNVLPPGSQDVADFSGQMDGNNCTLTLKQSGTYKIRVYQMRSSARKGTKVNYTLTISITGAMTKSTDAKVAGTNYHATGEIRSALGSTPKTTKFGVIRSKDGGEVHATMNGKSKRIFVFSKGEWSCKSSNCKLTFAKISSDEWEVICNGTEKYYIPDGVIYGG